MDKLNFEIIEFKPLFLKDIQRIYNYYVNNSTATFHCHPLSLEEIEQMITFSQERYKTFVLVDKATVYGYTYISPISPREAYLRSAEVTIYLDPLYTGKGIGSLALDLIEKHALKNNIFTLIAKICAENQNSMKLFEKNGFFRCAHYKNIGEKFGKILDSYSYEKIL